MDDDRIMMDKEATCSLCKGERVIKAGNGTKKCPQCNGVGQEKVAEDMMNKSHDENLNNPMDKVAEDLHGKS